ncbi:MAG: hypothetical protein H6Q74_2086 [Firmicutes bacterium]|nr:hypothetical protein [Bacillota bacterium]
MLTLLLIILGIYLVYRLLRPRRYQQPPYNPMGYGGSGMGSMFGGMILGYLLTHYLIDQSQYDMWSNLNDEQLRDTLVSQGVLNDADYGQLVDQASAGTLLNNDGAGNTAEWGNSNNDYSEPSSFDDYDNSGFGGDDFGGFDI